MALTATKRPQTFELLGTMGKQSTLFMDYWKPLHRRMKIFAFLSGSADRVLKSSLMVFLANATSRPAHLESDVTWIPESFTFLLHLWGRDRPLRFLKSSDISPLEVKVLMFCLVGREPQSAGLILAEFVSAEMIDQPLDRVEMCTASQPAGIVSIQKDSSSSD